MTDLPTEYFREVGCVLSIEIAAVELLMTLGAKRYQVRVVITTLLAA